MLGGRHGEVIYSERLEGLSSTWASPIVDANGRLYFANAGKSYVLQSSPEFRVLAVNDPRRQSSVTARSQRKAVPGRSETLYCIGER